MKEWSMKPILSNERGMALAVAIFALVVVGALVAGAFFAGTQEQRVGENSRRVTQSFGAAEAGLNEIIRNWQPQAINHVRQYPLDSVAVPLNLADTITPDGTGIYGGYIYRLNDEVYLVDITARDRKSATGVIGGGARQRLGELVRIRTLDLKIGAALTTRGGVSLKGNALVNGRDTVPQGWNTSYCDTLGDTTKAGIRTTDTSQVSTQRAGQLDGNPPKTQDTSIHANTFTQFGDVSYASLAAAAGIQLSGGNYKTQPVVTGGVCDRSPLTQQLNWGDGMNPSLPCGNYFPIVHVAGDVTLNGDQGQGVLLVDGNLNIQGSYVFYGVVIVQGDIKTAGGGSTDAHFYGAVMANNVDLTLNSLAGNATLQYSKCAITNALEGTMVVTPVRSRGWSQLY
ncbi:MAG: hypothetical protein AUH46_05795 [Gemmatimonadetes bacterium 13_1_40CM_70_15]|nr:MAG: hypothetical protein AUH46_05795 [Gemmatimonadetes bacterium 13_1_40CM_70_15]